MLLLSTWHCPFLGEDMRSLPKLLTSNMLSQFSKCVVHSNAVSSYFWAKCQVQSVFWKRTPSSDQLDSNDSPGKYFQLDWTHLIKLLTPQVPHSPLDQCYVITSIAMSICGMGLSRVHDVLRKKYCVPQEIAIWACHEHIHLAGAVQFKYPKGFP